METKPHLKSKTMQGLVVLLVILFLNVTGMLDGILDEDVELSYDNIGQPNGQKTDEVKNLLMLIGIGWGAYGRKTATTVLGKGDENETQ